MAVKERLTAKAGPLPVYGWAIVIAAVIGGVLWYRSKKAANSASQQDSAPSDTASNMADQIPVGTAAQIQADYTLSNQLGLATSDIANLATNVGHNTTATASNTAAENANTKAEKSNTTTVKSLTSAIHHRNPIKGNGGHKTRPGGRTYTVKPGDTLSKIASAYHLAGWGALYEANKHVIGGNPNQIRPGMKLVIP